MPKRWRISVFCRALTFISKKFRFFASENAEFYFPFVVRSLRDEHTTNRLEAERKHHSSCLSCVTTAQRMSGRIFLFPLLSLASLLSLSYVFLGNSMFSLSFCTCPPLPIKEKEGWWTSKITYKHIFLQISHKCIFFNLYFFLYVFVSFSIICHQKSCTFKGNWDGICEIMVFITPPNLSPCLSSSNLELFILWPHVIPNSIELLVLICCSS